MNKGITKVRLGSVCELHRGYDLPNHCRQEGPYPVISSSGISGMHNEYKCEGENIITGRYGTIGEVYYYKGKCWPLNTALYVSNCYGNVPRYVYYFLKHNLKIDGKDKSTVPGVDRKVLHEMIVSYHSDRAYQKTIADFISKIDDKIDLNSRLCAELEAMAKALYDYWFVQFDFLDENGKPYRTSGGEMVWCKELGQEVPKGWKVGTLADLVIIQKESFDPSTYGEESIEHYSIPAFDNGPFPAFETASSILSGKYAVPEGALLFSKLNPQFKRIWDPPCLTELRACSTEYMVYMPINKTARPFVFSVLNSDAFYRFTVQIASSSTGSRKRVDPDATLKYGISIPKENTLDQFGSLINPILKKIKQLRKEKYELVQLRDWLLPMLMNGQATVSSVLGR